MSDYTLRDPRFELWCGPCRYNTGPCLGTVWFVDQFYRCSGKRLAPPPKPE